jgi:hypothetical protein
VGAVSDAVQQRFAQARVRNDLGPLRKWQVRCQQHRGTFGAIGDDLDQKLGAELGQGHIANLVDGDNVVARPPTQSAPQLELLLGFDQLVDQRRRGREAHTPSLAAGGHTQCRQQMGFASTRVADKHDRFGALQVATLRQLAQLRGRDRRRLAEVELIQRFDPRQVRLFDASVDRAPFPILELGGQERLQVAQIRLTLAFGLFGQRRALAGDGRQMQHHALLLDDGLPYARLAFRTRAHRAAPATSSSS